MRVLWTIPALSDIEDISDYIAQDSPVAAYNLIGEIISRTETLLAENPMIGRRGRSQGTRELVITGTSYIVAYRIRSDVEVVAVVHGARQWPETFS